MDNPICCEMIKEDHDSFQLLKLILLRHFHSLLHFIKLQFVGYLIIFILQGCFQGISHENLFNAFFSFLIEVPQLVHV